MAAGLLESSYRVVPSVQGVHRELAKGTANTILLDGRGWVNRYLRPALACALLIVASASAQAQDASCPANLGTASIIDHDFTVSFCELCDVGTVRIEVENPFRNNDDADMSDIVITENLLASGLTYVPNTTQFSGGNAPPDVEPTVNGSQITWTLSDQFVLPARASGGGGNGAGFILEFQVRRDVDPEGLVGANRNIQAEIEFTPSCDLNFRQQSIGGFGELRLDEPEPTVTKVGRNLDAGQGRNQYSNTIYGHENDDAIWRIRVQNNGTAPLQDLRFDDNMQPGNFLIDYICDDEGDAESAGSGGGAGGCEPVGGVTDLNNVDVADLFGGASPYIVAQPGQFAD